MYPTKKTDLDIILQKHPWIIRGQNFHHSFQYCHAKFYIKSPGKALLYYHHGLTTEILAEFLVEKCTQISTLNASVIVVCYPTK